MYLLFLKNGTSTSGACPSRASDNFFRLAFTCNKIRATTAKISDKIPNNKELSSSAGAPAAAPPGVAAPGAGTEATYFKMASISSFFKFGNWFIAVLLYSRYNLFAYASPVFRKAALFLIQEYNFSLLSQRPSTPASAGPVEFLCT